MAATPSARGRAERWRASAGPVVLVLALVVAALLPLVRVGRFYFRGDTQIAYVGWWYHLGERVLAGDLPLMEPLAWEAGNYVAEGQWGLFSPLTILIGVLATVVPDLVVFVTVLKIGLVVLGGTGTYLVARDYGARVPFAVVGGLVVGLTAQSVFADWPSWVNGQIGVALLPWAWWATRRAMAGRSPVWALVLCYLVVSVGYVFCALYLAIILLGCLVDAALTRSRREVLTVLGLGVVSGLVTVAVYLPGLLTAPVTGRGSWEVLGEGRGTWDAQGFLVSMLPQPRRYYVAWLLPAFLWLDLRRLRGSARDLVGAGVALLVLVVWILGPSAIGPLRWPSRVLPALAVPLVVLLVVIASRCLPERVPRGRLVLSVVWVLAAGYVVVAREPEQLKAAGAGALLVVAALVVAAWSLRLRRAWLTTGVVLASTLAVLAFQLVVNPRPGAEDRRMPAAPAQYAGRIPSAEGDVMVLGNAVGRVVREPSIADDLLIGASWYLDPHDVQNGYTTISFTAFRDRFCRMFNGATCSKALARVLADEPTTGEPWVDLLSVSTLVLFRPSFPDTDLASAPDGWSVTQETQHTVVWTRDEPLPTAGGVVATTAGTTVSAERVSDREVDLRVTGVAPEGGMVTLSRLAWPGYTVEGARLAAPLDDMLVRVEVPAGSAGSTVTVRWRPPGWTVELAAIATAVLGGLVWAVLAGLASRRRRRPGA
ncbi:hypothetical protein [Oryzobacter terrae]|uniref:hypothetical protein n=1 Tax=Oryzobacter terrae TaxID=1620385 RepID=UPI00366B9E52